MESANQSIGGEDADEGCTDETAPGASLTKEEEGEEKAADETIAAEDEDGVEAPPSCASAPSTHAVLLAAVEESSSSTRPLVELFYRPTTGGGGRGRASGDGNNGGGGQSAAGGLSVRRRRDAICDVVRSPKFNRARARRLFAGLEPILRGVAEGQGSDGECADDEGPDDDRSDNEDSDNDDDEEGPARAILFLRCCAFLTEAYLDGLLARRQRSSRGSSSGVGRPRIEVIDEAFSVAESLHDLLFSLQSVPGTGTAPGEGGATDPVI